MADTAAGGAGGGSLRFRRVAALRREAAEATEASWLNSQRLSLFLAIMALLCLTWLIVFTRPRSRGPEAFSGPDASQQSLIAPRLCNGTFTTAHNHYNGSQLWIPVGGRMESVPTTRPVPPSAAEYTPKYCFIARTDATHFPSSSFFSVDRFVASLEMQTFGHWHLVLVDTDPSRPFPYLYNQLAAWVSRMDPLRIRIVGTADTAPNPYLDALSSVVAAEELPADKAARDVYWKTDDAIQRHCPESSEYLIVTDGNSWYDPHFLQEAEHIHAAQHRTDIIATDYYSSKIPWSTKQDINARQIGMCHMLQEFRPSVCNALVPGQFEMGALIFNLIRWRQEHIAFSDAPEDCLLQPTQFHNCLVTQLRQVNLWSAERIPRLLFSDAPSFWLCLLYGGQLLHLPRPDGDFQCVSSRENALLVAQEPLTSVVVAGGTCYHPTRCTDSPSS